MVLFFFSQSKCLYSVEALHDKTERILLLPILCEDSCKCSQAIANITVNGLAVQEIPVISPQNLVRGLHFYSACLLYFYM